MKLSEHLRRAFGALGNGCWNPQAVVAEAKVAGRWVHCEVDDEVAERFSILGALQRIGPHDAALRALAAQVPWWLARVVSTKEPLVLVEAAVGVWECDPARRFEDLRHAFARAILRAEAAERGG